MPESLQSPGVSQRSLAEETARLPDLSGVLNLIRRSTGMRLVALLREGVPGGTVLQCRDDLDIGLSPGDTLLLDSPRAAKLDRPEELAIQDGLEGKHRVGAASASRPREFAVCFAYPVRRRDGSVFGCLCGFDPEPQSLDATETEELLAPLAELIAFHLAERSDAETAKQTRDIEKFISVLSHDLRSPLGVIQTCGHLVSRQDLPEAATQHLQLISHCSARMLDMIRKLQQFARCTLGEGFELRLSSDRTALVDSLEQTNVEFRKRQGDERLRWRESISEPVTCDLFRIRRLYELLLDNAVQHGPDGVTIEAEASTREGHFLLSVSNAGDPIDEAQRATLFEPFTTTRGRDGDSLGLGLFLAAEIARAHGATLEVDHRDGKNIFSLSLPTSP